MLLIYFSFVSSLVSAEYPSSQMFIDLSEEQDISEVPPAEKASAVTVLACFPFRMNSCFPSPRFQTLTVLSLLPVAIYLLFGKTAIAVTDFKCPVRQAISVRSLSLWM